jgi:hypothetical protein
MPEDTEMQAALNELRSIPEFGWIVSDVKPWYTVSEVAELAGVSRDVVRGWIEQHLIRGATLYSAQVGWRMPRSGLAIHFAESVRQSSAQAG